MAITRKKNQGRVIDLDGPQGNAYFLMGQARRWGNQIEKGKGEKLVKEMSTGDYLNLLRVFEREFGMFCELQTENEEYLYHLGKVG